MSIVERDRLALREAIDAQGRFTQAWIRKARGGAPCWYKHTELMVRKLLARKYAVRIDRGVYQLTDAGLAFIRSCSVANTP